MLEVSQIMNSIGLFHSVAWSNSIVDIWQRKGTQVRSVSRHRQYSTSCWFNV